MLLPLLLLGPKRVRRFPAFRRRIDRVDELIYREIAERRRAGDLEERDDILSMLVAARHEDGSPMSDEEMRDELLTLLVAGHETTATSLSWAVERLARHPEKLERLRDGGRGRRGRRYLTATIQETLRLRPVISIVIRRLTEPVEIGGYELPAGVSVTPSSTSSTATPRSIPTRTASSPSASSTTHPAPTPGSPSAAASAAASAPPSPSSRWRSSSRSWSSATNPPGQPQARASLPPRDHRDPAPQRQGHPQLTVLTSECRCTVSVKARTSGNWTPDGMPERAALRVTTRADPVERVEQVFALSRAMSQLAEAGRR